MAQFGRQAIDGLQMARMDVLHVAQPKIDEADARTFERGLDAAAAVVANDHDVLHLQYIDRVLDHRQRVEVGMHDHVGDVAVDEDLARQQADDLVGRHARVGTADPEVLRGLKLRQLAEEAGVELLHLARPRLVVVEQVEEVLVADLVLRPVLQVQGQEDRTLDRRG